MTDSDGSSELSSSWLVSEAAALQSTVVYPLFFSDGAQSLGDGSGYSFSGSRPPRSRPPRAGSVDTDELSSDDDDDDSADLLSPQPSPSATDSLSVLHPHSEDDEDHSAMDRELERFQADMKAQLASQCRAAASLTHPAHPFSLIALTRPSRCCAQCCRASSAARCRQWCSHSSARCWASPSTKSDWTELQRFPLPPASMALYSGVVHLYRTCHQPTAARHSTSCERRMCAVLYSVQYSPVCIVPVSHSAAL